ncbi:MAG: hypothetical protein ACRD3W_26945, partial [Terriglobales bacterium]
MRRERRIHEGNLIGRSLSPLIAAQLILSFGASACFAAGTADGAMRSSGLPLPYMSDDQVQQLLFVGANEKTATPKVAIVPETTPAPDLSPAPGWNEISSDVGTLLRPSITTAAPPAAEQKNTEAAAPVSQQAAATTSATAEAAPPAVTDQAAVEPTATAPTSESTLTTSSADQLKDKPVVAFTAPDVHIGDTANAEVPGGDGPIVVDNDEAQEVTETIKYEELPTDEGKTKVKTGAKFPVVICSEISSKSAKKGDPVEARLKFDLKIGDRLVAKKGSVVTGHINYSLKARSPMRSLISPERWYKDSGCLGIMFDEIVNEQGEHLPLVATPARQALYVKNKAEGRVLGINHKGEVAGQW